VTALASDVAEVATGVAYSCARKKDGTLWCWGNNIWGVLGDGTTTSSPVPVQVTSLGNTVARVFAGNSNVCALKTDGTAWCWGQNLFGVVGDGTETDRLSPVQVTTLGTDATEIGIYETYACAARMDGTVWCWGWGLYGAFGEEPTPDERLVPEKVTAFVGTATEITVGRYHNCALKTDRTVWCWGADTHGELGAGSVSTQGCYDGAERCRPSPVPVMLGCP